MKSTNAQWCLVRIPLYCDTILSLCVNAIQCASAHNQVVLVLPVRGLWCQIWLGISQRHDWRSVRFSDLERSRAQGTSLIEFIRTVMKNISTFQKNEKFYFLVERKNSIGKLSGSFLRNALKCSPFFLHIDQVLSDTEIRSMSLRYRCFTYDASI